MQFLKAVAAGAFAFASLVTALDAPRLSFTNVPTEVTAGQPATIQYTAQILSQPATITLRKGDPANLDTIAVLTSDAVNGSYTWIPSKSLSNASDYALEITQGQMINYSALFSLTGANAAAVSSAQSATSSSNAAASIITASAISSIQSVIASYNSSLGNLTGIVSIQTSPPNPPANTTVVIVAPSAGTGSPVTRNSTLVIPTLTAASSASNSAQSNGANSQTGSGSGTTARAPTSAGASPSPSSTNAAAALAQASTPILSLFAVAAVFFFQ